MTGGYLLDTGTLSVLLDRHHPSHDDTVRALARLTEGPHHVSVVAIGELAFGAKNAAKIAGSALPSLESKIERATREFVLLPITHHTAIVYGELKATLAHKYLASTLRRDRPPYLQAWIDRATDQAIGIGENDLWICAQAKERNLTIVGRDRMRRIVDADDTLNLIAI